MDNVREMKKRQDLIVEKDQQLMEDEKAQNTLPSDSDVEENTTTCTTSTISTTVDVEITSPPVIVRASSRISQKNKTKSPITVSVEGKDLSTSASDPKGYRLTSQQRLSSAAREVKEKRKCNIAFNEACILLRNERKKHKGSKTSKALTANQVAEQVGKKYNVSLSKRSLNRKLLSGESFHLCCGGPKGFFATDIEYTCLKAAFSTAVSLHQSTKNSEAKAGEWKTALQHFLGNEAQGKTSGLNLYMRLTRDCSTLLNIDSEYFVELWRQQWTNDFNLNHWFDNWKKFCLFMDSPRLMKCVTKKGRLFLKSHLQKNKRDESLIWTKLRLRWKGRMVVKEGGLPRFYPRRVLREQEPAVTRVTLL